ncbi:ABC transporter permease [Paraclostridium sp. AKS46]|nr:ABC transporter permease [Paraclostridium sp. AKS46]
MENLKLVVKYIKSYKSRSIAIMISMIFSIGLIVGVGTLRETNNDIELQSMKHKTGPYQVVFDDVNKNQFKKLRLNKNIKHLGIQYLYNVTASQEKQSISIMGANNDYILSNSKLLFGRLPEKNNEVVAEEWILRSLGIDLKPNQEINLKVENGSNRYKEETFKLVGILNDISSNKLYGRKNIFINQNIMNSTKLSISVEFKNGVDIYNEINNICDEIGISKENINVKDDMVELENIKNSTNLDDISFIVAISLVCGFVIYGIFNISIHSRIREYSILRSIGFNNFNIFKLVLEELLLMYLISLPIGIFLGSIGAVLFNKISNNIDINIILHGEIVKFKIIFPIFVILISTLFIGVLVLLISYLLYRKIKKISVIDGIKKNFNTNNFKRNIISVTKLRKLMKTYAALAFKNILRNKKHS